MRTETIEPLFPTKHEKMILEFGSYVMLSVEIDQNGTRYLALFLDDDNVSGESKYLLTKITNRDLLGLLECRLPIRSLFTKYDKVWIEYFKKTEPYQVYEEKKVSELTDDLLPVLDEAFEYQDADWKKYIEKIRGLL